MGTVYLTNGHHGLYIRDSDTDLSKRVELTGELLARPILDRSGKEARDLTQNLIRAALQALMDMTTFSAAASYLVLRVKEVPHIAVPHRQWAEITLGRPDNVVAYFSHDSRYDNYPFYNITQWLESERLEDDLSEADFTEFAQEWTSPEKWKMFFLERIRREQDSTWSEVKDLREKIANLTKRAQTISVALSAQ